MDPLTVDPFRHVAEEVKLCSRCTFVLSQPPANSLDTDLRPPHHGDGADILNAADDGCRICRLVVAELQSLFGADDLAEKLRFLDTRGTWYQWKGDNYGRDCDLNIYVTVRPTFIDLPSPASFCLAKLSIDSLDLTPPHEVLAQSTICGTLSSGFTGSDACWSRVLAWHHDCLQNHNKCGQFRSSPGQKVAWLPTRLLDVGVQGDQAVRLALTETSPCEGPYMTLSHRWGTGPMYTLTSATLPVLLAGVDISELPRTFREAIEVTRRFGVRYLWIDSLCIIQDSADDWRKESVQMVHVYSNSHLNIAATASENAEQGLFRPRQADPSWPWQARARFGDGHVGRCLIYDREMLLKGLSKAPLNLRAWVMQERLLAPRVLHFAASQLFWECHQRTSSEMFPIQLPSRVFLEAWEFGLGKSLDPDYIAETTPLFSPSPLQPSESLFRMWDLIVSQYTVCAITNPQDKLVAISGLAQHIAGKLGNADTYLAGLWKSMLPRQLLWGVSERAGRPPVYRAPSWSWASVEAPVYMHDCMLGKDQSRALATVLDASVTPLDGGDAFGQLVGGSIRLRGMLLTRLRIRHTGVLGFYRFVEVEQDDCWGRVYVSPDVAQDNAALATQWFDCMAIEQQGSHHDARIECLLFRPARQAPGNNEDTDTCYERFGTARFDNDTLALWNDDDLGADMRRQVGCGFVPEADIIV